MSKLLDDINKREDEMIDTYLMLFGQISKSILKKIKARDSFLFAAIMADMASVYRNEEEMARLERERLEQ